MNFFKPVTLLDRIRIELHCCVKISNESISEDFENTNKMQTLDKGFVKQYVEVSIFTLTLQVKDIEP